MRSCQYIPRNPLLSTGTRKRLHHTLVSVNPGMQTSFVPQRLQFASLGEPTVDMQIGAPVEATVEVTAKGTADREIMSGHGAQRARRTRSRPACPMLLCLRVKSQAKAPLESPGGADYRHPGRNRCTPILTVLTMITTAVASEAAPGRRSDRPRR